MTQPKPKRTGKRAGALPKQNPKAAAQRRQALRAHYAAKYRSR